MLDIPFYINKGHKCAQAAMKSVLGARISQKKFSYYELDRLTGHSKDEITFPIQIAAGLTKTEIRFRYYAKPRLKEIISIPNLKDLIAKKYGKKIVDKINFNSLKEAMLILANDQRVIETLKKPSISELERFVNEGKIPICLVNYDILTGRENRFGGHYIIITGFQCGEVIYHDSGPKDPAPNKRVSKERFEQAWDLCFFDHDLIVVN